MVGFSVIPGTVVAFLALDTFADSSRASTLEALAGIARAKAEAIDSFIGSRKADVKRLADMLGDPVTRLATAKEKEEPEPTPPEEPAPKLQDAEKLPDGTTPGETPPEEGAGEPPPPPEPEPVEEPPQVVSARKEIRQLLGLALGDQEIFEELLVMRPDGKVIVSTFSDHEGKTAAELEYFKRGSAATYLQPVFVSPITNVLTMVIATPIRGPENQNIGVLAARLNLKRFFRLINDYTGLGKTGETVVAKKIDDALVFMAPTRHDDKAALQRRMPTDTSAPITAGARGDTGRGPGSDYRGEPVLAAWTFAPTLEWGVVTKIDLDEANAPIAEVRTRVLFITLAVIALAVIVALIVARTMIEPLRRLKNATEKISKGNLEVDLGISSSDEIGELADSFERMVAAIKFFREQSHEDDDEEEALREGRPPGES